MSVIHKKLILSNTNNQLLKLNLILINLLTPLTFFIFLILLDILLDMFAKLFKKKSNYADIDLQDCHHCDKA